MKPIISSIISCVLGVMALSQSPGFFVSQANAACADKAGPSVDWQNCRKRNLIMGGFDFSGSNFTRTDLSASDLRNSNLSKTVFFKTNLVRASLAGSQAQNANFEGVIASRTDFSRGNFQDTIFLKAEISRSNFSNSNLQNANMSNADFSRVNFFNADMKGVDLSFTNISRANLQDAVIDENLSLVGAYMFRTLIENLDLSVVNGLEQWQIDMACGNGKTILPAGLSKPTTWPCKFDAAE